MDWPVHIVGDDALIVTVGNAITTTVTCAELEQPFASVPVTL